MKQLFGRQRPLQKNISVFLSPSLLSLILMGASVVKIGRREKTPTPKIWTLLRTPSRFTTRPLPVHFTTKMSVVRPFSVLSKDEIGP